ncbi:MAG: hypothetical protein Q7Q71_12435 [Verrucomicrobiota bacterium JB023]|nr:hypothetical protein [Verrucomicrobiota bacterium JB023]
MKNRPTKSDFEHHIGRTFLVESGQSQAVKSGEWKLLRVESLPTLSIPGTQIGESLTLLYEQVDGDWAGQGMVRLTLDGQSWELFAVAGAGREVNITIN